MEHMGGPISKVRDSFTRVIQSDMRPQPDQIGGPVADLQGRVVGITMARADRTRAFIMPGSAVETLLLKDSLAPALAKVRSNEEKSSLDLRKRVPQNGMQGGDNERTRRHLSRMQRLLDHLRGEMVPFEQGR
jgi:S1-C subfamily serine protease